MRWLRLLPVSQMVEMWVKSALTNWYTCFPDRNRWYDEYVRLLVWDLVGSALAYADYDALVALLAGETVSSENLFTWSLYRCILNDRQLFEPVQALAHDVPHAFAYADSLKEWFRVHIDAWIDLSAPQRQRSLPISVLVYSFIQNTYAVISWEHVARAFREGY